MLANLVEQHKIFKVSSIAASRSSRNVSAHFMYCLYVVLGKPMAHTMWWPTVEAGAPTGTTPVLLLLTFIIRSMMPLIIFALIWDLFHTLVTYSNGWSGRLATTLHPSIHPLAYTHDATKSETLWLSDAAASEVGIPSRHGPSGERKKRAKK